tara:strand:- start:2287 stop:2955 length:669 start_codon:yes stop_codon:yes gene_type:complete
MPPQLIAPQDLPDRDRLGLTEDAILGVDPERGREQIMRGEMPMGADARIKALMKALPPRNTGPVVGSNAADARSMNVDDFVKKLRNWDPSQEAMFATNPNAGRNAFVGRVAGTTGRQEQVLGGIQPKLVKKLDDGLEIRQSGHGNHQQFVLGKPEEKQFRVFGKISFNEKGVDNFAIREELQGKGLGQELMKAASEAGLNPTEAKLRSEDFLKAVHRFSNAP